MIQIISNKIFLITQSVKVLTLPLTNMKINTINRLIQLLDKRLDRKGINSSRK